MKMQSKIVLLSFAALICTSAFADYTPVTFSSAVSSGSSSTAMSFSSITTAPGTSGLNGFAGCSSTASTLNCKTFYPSNTKSTLSATVYQSQSPTEQQLVGTLTYLNDNGDGTVSVSFVSANPGLSCELSPASQPSGPQYGLNAMPAGAANVTLACLTVPTPAPPTPTPTILEFTSQLSGGVFSSTPDWTTGFLGCEVQASTTQIICPKVDLSMVGSSFTVDVSNGSTVLGMLTYTVLSNATVGVALTPASGMPSGCHATQTQIPPTSTSIETDADVSSCVPPPSQSNNSKNWIKMAEAALKAAVRKIVAL